jgi:hypothetical protein
VLDRELVLHRKGDLCATARPERHEQQRDCGPIHSIAAIEPADREQLALLVSPIAEATK